MKREEAIFLALTLSLCTFICGLFVGRASIICRIERWAIDNGYAEYRVGKKTGSVDLVWSIQNPFEIRSKK